MVDDSDLEELVQQKLVTDVESILKDHIERVEDIIKIHGDGSVALTSKCDDLPPQERALGYFIGARYAEEGDLRETGELDNSFFYNLLPAAESTTRKYLMELRDEGFLTKGENGNRLVSENLPRALKRIEEKIEN